MLSPLPPITHRAEDAVLGQQALHAVEDRFVQRHIHHLAASFGRFFTDALGSGLQCQQHTDHAVQRGQRVAQAHARAHRHPAGLAHQVAQAAHRFGHHCEAGQVAVRAGLAVAADAQHDQPGVLSRQRLVAQSPFLQRAGLEVLDQHIGLGGQTARVGAAFVGAQVQHHALLVAALHLPPHAGALVQHPPLAQRVAVAGRLDLDDLGAEVGQGLAGKRPGDQLAEFQHLQTGQRAGRWGGRWVGVCHGSCIVARSRCQRQPRPLLASAACASLGRVDAAPCETSSNPTLG